MQKIVDGVLKFKADVFPDHADLFSELSSGQSPEVLMVTCADSRIDPAMITQSLPGDLFMCRNAGNIVPPYSSSAEGNTASIEYAIAALGIQHIVVCGHTDCGAMKGALNPDALTALPHVCGWLENSKAAVDDAKAKHPDADDKELLSAVIEQNVLLQLAHLKTHPYVAEALEAGKLQLHGWVYDIGSGAIYSHNEDSGAFEPLTAVHDSVA